MKRLFPALKCTVALIATLASFPAVATPKGQQVTLFLGARENGTSQSLSYVMAPNHDLAAEGILLRANLGVGTPDAGETSTSGDVMLGYPFVPNGWKVRVFAGVSAVNGMSTPAGLKNDTGLKVMGQVQARKALPVYLNTTWSYEAIEQAYQVSVQLGSRFDAVTVGPELSVAGREGYHALRLGVMATEMKLGALGVTLRTGYSFNTETSRGKDTPYLALSSTLQF